MSTPNPAPVIPTIGYTSAPALEIIVLGDGKRISQARVLAELEKLGQGWRLETPHELFALRSPLNHKNAKGAHSYDESIEPDAYWTSEETPLHKDGRVVVDFFYGGVSLCNGYFCAFARAVRVSCQ